jgi:hypothetical protein
MKKKYIAPEIRINVMDASSGFAAGSGSSGVEVTTSDGTSIPDKNGKEDPTVVGLRKTIYGVIGIKSKTKKIIEYSPFVILQIERENCNIYKKTHKVAVNPG